MALTTLTLFSLVTLQRNDMFTGLVEDVTTYAPEFSKVPVVTRSGTYYEIVRRTALPTSGFRAINNGASSSASSFKKELHEMFFLDAPINVDEAIVKGDDRSTGDVLSHEAQGTLQSAIITIGSQFYYGTANNAYGFAGLRSQLSGVITTGQTTSTTSAYLVWFNPWGVNFDVGRDGEIAMKPWNIQQISAPASGATGNIFAWVSNLSCFIGLSVKSTYSVWAVVGVKTANAFTDALGAQLISLIPLNRRQGLVWFMNRTCHFTLQNSRSAILYQPASSAGTPAWSPYPEECNGYPIVITDSITNTESN